MFTKRIIAKALQVVRTINGDLIEIFAFRDFTRNYLRLQVACLVVLVPVVAETLGKGTIVFHSRPSTFFQ
jgi:hypothetical protein